MFTLVLDKMNSKSVLLIILLLFDSYILSVKTRPSRNHHDYPDRNHSGIPIGANTG